MTYDIYIYIYIYEVWYPDQNVEENLPNWAPGWVHLEPEWGSQRAFFGLPHWQTQWALQWTFFGFPRWVFSGHFSGTAVVRQWPLANHGFSGRPGTPGPGWFASGPPVVRQWLASGPPVADLTFFARKGKKAVVRQWHGSGPPVVRQWLASGSSVADTPLANHWRATGVPLACHWRATGVPLADHWRTTSLAPLACHWLTQTFIQTFIPRVHANLPAGSATTASETAG